MYILNMPPQFLGPSKALVANSTKWADTVVGVITLVGKPTSEVRTQIPDMLPYMYRALLNIGGRSIRVLEETARVWWQSSHCEYSLGYRSVSVRAYHVSDGINIILYDGAPSGHYSLMENVLNTFSP